MKNSSLYLWRGKSTPHINGPYQQRGLRQIEDTGFEHITEISWSSCLFMHPADTATKQHKYFCDNLVKSDFHSTFGSAVVSTTPWEDICLCSMPHYIHLLLSLPLFVWSAVLWCAAWVSSTLVKTKTAACSDRKQCAVRLNQDSKRCRLLKKSDSRCSNG